MPGEESLVRWRPPEGSSSVGRASVSKTDGRGFESLLPCPDDRCRPPSWRCWSRSSGGSSVPRRLVPACPDADLPGDRGVVRSRFHGRRPARTPASSVRCSAPRGRRAGGDGRRRGGAGIAVPTAAGSGCGAVGALASRGGSDRVHGPARRCGSRGRHTRGARGRRRLRLPPPRHLPRLGLGARGGGAGDRGEPRRVVRAAAVLARRVLLRAPGPDRGAGWRQPVRRDIARSRRRPLRRVRRTEVGRHPRRVRTGVDHALERLRPRVA